MSEPDADGLWPFFAPLWTELRELSPKIVLGGGYGLFLKQQWLLSSYRARAGASTGGRPASAAAERTILDVSRWSNRVPRVTKDFDFIVSLDLIASEPDQRRMNELLQRYRFDVVPGNQRWQFERTLEGGGKVVIDFHAQAPEPGSPNVRVSDRRVKHGRSLGDMGIHARMHREVLGAETEPFAFRHRELEIALPNPVTFAVMKLIAARDRRVRSADANRPMLERRHEAQQADKHARDLFRLVAMTTRGEYDAAVRVRQRLTGSPGFTDAAQIYAGLFSSAGQWGCDSAYQDGWTQEDLGEMLPVLAAWFRA